MAKTSTSFKRGHKFGKGSNGQLRRDLTIELISQLNEIDKVNAGTGAGRLKLHRIVENLILQACGIDERDAEGNITKRDRGDLRAIQEIFDRLEGRVTQKIVGPDDGPVQLELRTIEDVKMFLLERGIDVERLPNPFAYIDDRRRD
jgi:hypothetical protein